MCQANLLGGGSPQCNVLPVSLGKVDAVKVFPAKTVREGRALRVPHGERGKGILGPFRREGELQLRGCGNDH